MTQKLQALSGTLMVCATYVYFLIYSQFAFLDRITEVLPDRSPDPILGAMGLAGLMGAGAAGRILKTRPMITTMLWSLMGCSMAASVTPFLDSAPLFGLVAALMGFSLGMETVTLATLLPRLCGGRYFGRFVGLGTGLAYFFCNVPALFAASSSVRSFAAAGFAFAAMLLCAAIPLSLESEGERSLPRHPGVTSIDFKGKGFVLLLLCFTALIWLDSALFYIIQQSADLKAVTWSSTSQKWINGSIHLFAALTAGFALDRGRLTLLLPAAFLFLAAGSVCLILGRGVVWAAPLYVVGVSFYSTALVAFPGMFPEGDGRLPVRVRAAWIYGVAGWLGSAMGIGMARDLNRIPILFLAISGLLIFGVSVYRIGRRMGKAIPAPLLLLLVSGFSLMRCYAPASTGPRPQPSAERGREVYISEGCIHCHSQYVRPGTRDEIIWGPYVDPEILQANQPPLVGNRRQGPDLLNVGNRRGGVWQRQHLKDPRALNPFSTMPSYQYLFQDERGEDLVAYLNQLGEGTLEARLAARTAWRPDPEARPISLRHAATRFANDCAPCHGADARGDGPLADLFPRRPRDLVNEPFRFFNEAMEDADLQLARMIKFGFPGTEMPGHETLRDEEVMGLVVYVKAVRKRHLQVRMH